MTDFFLHLFYSFLQSDIKYLIISVISFLEGIPIIGTVIPGGTVSFIVGSYTVDEIFNPWLSLFLITFANFLGDIIGYFMGRKSHSITRIKKIVDKQNQSTAFDVFDKNLFYFVVIVRLIPVVRSMPSLIAGVRGVSFKKYVPLSFLGSFMWAFLGIFGGRVIGEVAGKYALAVIFGATLLAVIIGYLKKKFFPKKA
ncbi:MAG: rane-associated protein [Patescibacteria group bacterium]|jgi:membrane protein DedA with SNARE-associated domain|nr:rane-associated protein [Patescibacteria group bacterium]